MVFSGARQCKRNNSHKVCFKTFRLDVGGKVFPQEDGVALIHITREVEDLCP